MATYRVTAIDWSNDDVSISQTGTLEYKLWSDPVTSYIVVNAAVTVNTDGTLAAPQNIAGLVSGETYDIKFSNNCDSPALFWVSTVTVP